MSRQTWTDDTLLSRLMNNRSERSRWDTIKVLRSRPSEDLFKECWEFTRSNDPKIREIGIDILAQLGVPPRPFLQQSLVIFFDLLNTETDPKVLMSVLYAIGHNNDKLSKVQIKKVCSFRNSDDILIKKGLVSALGFIDDAEVIEVLIKMSDDRSSHIRNWATFYLAQGERNNKDIREALWARVNDKHQETRLEAIAGLAKRKDARVNEIIKRELNNGEYGTPLLEAIINTEDKSFLPMLRQNLSSIKGNKSIDPKWNNNLKECIAELTKLT